MPNDDFAILEKLDRYFRSALDHPTWVSWRKHAKQSYEYREGSQWTAAELAVLADRGQPATVNNQVKVTLDRMVGQFVKQRTKIGYRGRNPDDEPVAAALGDIFLFLRQNNNLEFEERDCAAHGFTGGFGVMQIFTTFDAMLQPSIVIRAVDPFEIFPDPYSRRYDWNEDAQFICHAKWLSFEEAKELYPEHGEQLAALGEMQMGGQLSGVEGFKNDNYVDYDENGKPRRVRVVECWYKIREREALLLGTDPATAAPVTLSANDLSRRERTKWKSAGAVEIERVNSRLKVGIFTAGILLSHKDSPHGMELFPFVPFYTDRRESGEPFSLVWTALTLQDAINKRESKALHLLNTNQAVIGQGAVNDKDELASEMAKPDGIIEVRNVEQFQLQRNTELAQSQFVMHQEAKADFRRVTGINPDALGERSEVRSGIGIARKQAMTDIVIAPVFDNFRRTRVLLARVTLRFVQRYFNEPLILAITDDLNATRAVAIGPDILRRAKQGIYDVVVEEQPDTTTIQQEQFATLGALLPQILPFGPAWVQLLIQMSDLRRKDELLKQVAQMSAPPPPEPKVSVTLQWAVLTPEERVAWAKKFNMPELAQAIMINPQPSADQRKAETEKMWAMVQAGNEQQRSQMEMSRGAMDMQQSREEHGMKMAEMAGKVIQQRQQHDMKMAEPRKESKE